MLLLPGEVLPTVASGRTEAVSNVMMEQLSSKSILKYHAARKTTT
jgi:hypothetical protein